MKGESLFPKLTRLIVQDTRLCFTIFSLFCVLIILLNLSTSSTPVIGIPATILYFLINATFIGHGVFQDERALIRFLMGNLLLIVVLALAGLVVMIIYNLDTNRIVLVLSIVSLFASALSRRKKLRYADR